jgi:MazG family protein
MDPNKLSRKIKVLTSLVARLRGPKGCPWDAKQTDSTIKNYLLEEAYEVVDAIEKSTPKDVCVELGDLLFQIMFLAQMASEREEFDFIEVMERITEKMVYRHPHVFGKIKVNNAEEVSLNWKDLKRSEKILAQDQSDPLDSIPLNLPALLRTHRIIERGSNGRIHKTKTEIFDEIRNDFKNLEASVNENNTKGIEKAIGNLLFFLVHLAEKEGLNAEAILRCVNNDFVEKLRKI